MPGPQGGFLIPPPAPLKLGGHRFDLTHRALVMGILNRTPDSFHQRHPTLDHALRRAEAVSAEGGDILDIGGVPAGAGPPVSVSEELDRVVPVVEAVTARWPLMISVDTTSAAVARDALAAGAVMVNDISGLADGELVPVVVAAGAAVAVTEIQGRARVPHLEPSYDDVVADVCRGLGRRLAGAQQRGLAPEQTVVDPGLDLGKTYPQSMVVLRRLGEVVELARPVLLSVSHKGFLGASVPLQVDQRHEASMAAVAYGFSQGARIMRVHDVAATVRVCRTLEAVVAAEADDPWVCRWAPLERSYG